MPDGVDLTAAEAVEPSRAWSDPPELLYLGSLHPWKGVGVPACRLADDFRSETGDRRRAAAWIAQLEQKAVELAGGGTGALSRPRSSRRRRFQVIADADICLLPLTDTSIGSRYTSPLKLFEYMAVGKPIVAADVPAIRSVITQGVDGILVPVDDHEQLASAITSLLVNRGLAAELGREARFRAGDYTWKARAASLRALFGDLKGAVA